MGIDLKKIESMRADLQREREAAAVGKNRERKRSAIDRAEQRRIEKFERIDKIIDGLQATIEAATLKGNRFADLLSISADELLHQPSEYFFLQT